MGGTGVDGPAGVMTWAMCLVLDVLSMSFPSCLAFVIATLSRSPGQELLEEFRHEHHGCDVSSRDQTSTSLCLTPTSESNGCWLVDRATQPVEVITGRILGCPASE